MSDDASQSPESTAESAGGPGGPFDLTRTREIRTVARLASRDDWQIPPEAFSVLPQKLLAIIQDPKSTRRAITSAVRALAALHAQNLNRSRVEVYTASIAQRARLPEPPKRDDVVEASESAPVAFLEAPTFEQLAETARVLDDLGIFADPPTE